MSRMNRFSTVSIFFRKGVLALFGCFMMAAWMACSTGPTDSSKPGVDWVQQPTATQKAGVAFEAKWKVMGSANTTFDHTNLHACPKGDAACEKPPAGKRTDSDVQSGKPGTFTGSLTLTEGEWDIFVHASIDGKDYTTPAFTIKVDP